MTRAELVKRIATYLHSNNIRKPVHAKRHTFHISDDEGNHKDFHVHQTDKTVMFTMDDINAVLDGYLTVVEDALKHGETVTIRNFGTFGLHYRAPRKARHPDTGELIDVPEQYVPKFSFANGLKMAARSYKLLLQENKLDEPLPLFDDAPEEEEDEE